MPWGINIVQVTTRYSSTRKIQLTQSNLFALTVYQQISVWLVVSSATQNGFSRIHHVSFLPNSSIGKLCKDLNTIVGKGIWYDTFQVHNTKWLWLVNDIATTFNSHNVLGATSGRYPSYVAGILNSKKIDSYVLWNKHINYAKYIKQCIAKKCTFKLRTHNYFVLSGCDRVKISFQSKFISYELPSEIIFAQSVLKNAFIVSSFRCCVYR